MSPRVPTTPATPKLAALKPDLVVVSDSRRNAATRLRAELAEEAVSGFPRLRRIPQTDIIWFLDYFAGLAKADQEGLLDTLADAAAMAFGPPWGPTLNERGTVDVPAGLARMCEARERSRSWML